MAGEVELLRSRLADAGAENARLENKLALAQHRLQEMRAGASGDLGAQVIKVQDRARARPEARVRIDTW